MNKNDLEFLLKIVNFFSMGYHLFSNISENKNKIVRIKTWLKKEIIEKSSNKQNYFEFKN